MPNIGDLDFGPAVPEIIQYEQIREILGRFTYQVWLNSNQVIPVNVLDFIGQYAAHNAIQNHALLFNNGPRSDSVGWAKAWVMGFVE